MYIDLAQFSVTSLQLVVKDVRAHQSVPGITSSATCSILDIIDYSIAPRLSIVRAHPTSLLLSHFFLRHFFTLTLFNLVCTELWSD